MCLCRHIRFTGLSCSKKRKQYETIHDYWKKQVEMYDARSVGGPKTDSEDLQDHGVWPEDL